MMLGFLVALVASASVEAEAVLLLAHEPLSQTEIRLLAQTDDVRALEILEVAFERRLEVRSRLGLFAPRELEDELAETLLAMERLDGSVAYDHAREILEQVPADCTAAMAAREVLARQGDISIIREALTRFFDDPGAWGKILGEASRSTEDPRLEDFRDMAGGMRPMASGAFFQTRIERELADSIDEWKLADLLFWAEENPGFTAARILSWIPEGSLHEGWVSYLLSVIGRSQEGAARLRALAALGWRKARKRSSSLVKALRGDDPVVAAVAARALGEMGHQPAAAALEPLTKSTDERLAAEAIRALVSLGGKQAALRLSQQARSESFLSAVALIEALDGRLEVDAAALASVVGRIEKVRDRARAIRLLAERDSPALTELDLGPSEVGTIYGCLARSSHRGVRSLVLKASGRTAGAALAALLLSPRATAAEKEKAAEALGKYWAEAIARGGPGAIEELDRLALRESAAKAYRDPSAWPARIDEPAMLDVLAILPGAEARQALENVGSVAAIERLKKRKDRALSMPALGRLRQQGEPDVREAAEVVLVGMGAPGSLAIVDRRLGRPDELRALVPALARAPRAVEAFEHLAQGQGARPDIQAALFAFYQIRPLDFRPLLSMKHPAARRRIHGALALSDGIGRLPLLVDSALNDPSKTIRLVAFRALSEVDLGLFGAWLHRAAGDDDPDIRWAAAMALTPAGETWSMRLLAAEMNGDSLRDRTAFRRVMRRLSSYDSRRLLEAMFWDETGNPFTDYLFYERVGGFAKDDEGRAWTLLSEQLDESPFILFMAAGLDLPAAAKAVYSRLR